MIAQNAARMVGNVRQQRRVESRVVLQPHGKAPLGLQHFFKLGKGGARLKAIGSAAREAISEHLGRKVHLFLHVKVNPKWDEDRGLYEDIGLDWSE